MPVPQYSEIGKFQVRRIIRSTGSSDLYECYDPDLEVRVAVKVFEPKKRLLDVLPYDRKNWEIRFMREARTLAQIDHPHVIPVRELSYVDNKPFYVMPFIKTNLLYEMGKDPGVDGYAPELSEAPGPRKLGLVRSADILCQLASALAAFHGRGLVHRDIKPGNILLTKLETGLVKLCDPGLMKSPKSEESLSGYWLGTEDYMSPEQKKSAADVDAASDIYSLAVLGFRMITGSLPEGVFDSFSDEVEAIPQNLNDLLIRSLAREKQKRPQNALEFLSEIGPIRAQLRSGGLHG